MLDGRGGFEGGLDSGAYREGDHRARHLHTRLTQFTQPVLVVRGGIEPPASQL